MNTIRILLSFFVILGLSSCGHFLSKDKKEKIVYRDIESYHDLKNIREAPDKIQEQARAVVLLENGTGLFVTYQGKPYLMTNEHVIGEDNCADVGCYQEIQTMYQFGSESSSQVLKLIPKQINSNLDFSLSEYVAVDSAKNPMAWTPPHSIELTTIDSASLINQNIHLVGHPSLSVKKWSTGKVFQSENGVLSTTAFALPGSSGSAVFDDNGSFVGIFHSAINSRGSLTPKDLTTVGFFSSVEVTQLV